MELEIAVLSRQGGRAVNEDACGWWSSGDMSFCVLSDGAGGHRGAGCGSHDEVVAAGALHQASLVPPAADAISAVSEDRAADSPPASGSGQAG